MRFLADESCDASVTRVLRTQGHDVKTVAETIPGAPDQAVLEMARSERRVLLTEDKDFGKLVFVAGATSIGVVLIRYPAPARALLPGAIIDLVAKHEADVPNSFVVIEPSRVRISALPIE